MSIKVVAKFVLKEGCKDALKAVLEELVQKTRLEEGNISYALYESLDDPNVATMLEEWESKEALDAHMKTEHFTRIVPQVDEFLAAPVTVEAYTQLI